MLLNKIKRKANMDVDFGSGLDSKEEFFKFLDTVGVEKSEDLYEYYIKCYNNALDFMCEWVEALAECFD